MIGGIGVGIQVLRYAINGGEKNGKNNMSNL